ncbi:glycoside hydrolase family 18 protein [Aspergillus niger CBS 101883]|uniref:glycoside hydrolase family 18 protein n=1 Tax=Aspergillus lacticoffeatus (strain CBS 101883) TaxID=1450533 RepID=UPI000D7F64AC|nr:glycoside hydrolase [Aspergillus niger CBS 101883]PYH52732.1 glycoside hydrolase [Aspergillus niger CBS 101883]
MTQPDAKPLSGAASVSVLNKVIGYYESWMAQKGCHKVTPTDLPLDAPTHINFAFAYINTRTCNIHTMDSGTPSSLCQDATNVKSFKHDINVFISVGGWTFSDNNTGTQHIHVADNVLHLLKQYGFDGLDIDWEYPGAGDRGGSPEDTANYVLLLKALQETLNASGSKLGLTFTAPSSYWYLRWVDLPNMIRYADWINLMSYDIHGVWGSRDTIGSIIELAVDLFWRVNIPPEKIVMGFGFYGRSFTLAYKFCTNPGCLSKGASSPGPYSDTGSITITPVYDRAAAVKYYTFDNDQWFSYDDGSTFAQKIAWANEVGLGGAMIWASDLGKYKSIFACRSMAIYDDKYSTHAGLTNKTIMSNPTLQGIDKSLPNPKSVIQFDGQNCLNDKDAMANAGRSGYTVVGWDDAGYGKKNCHCGKPVCCPTSSAAKDCIWRGDNTGDAGVSSNWNAQCQDGEINIAGIRSSWGGGFVNDGDTDKCELAIDRATYGDLSSGCDWNIKKVACCAAQKAAREPGTCGADLCSLFPGWCPDDSSNENSVSYRKGTSKQYFVKVRGVLVETVAVAYPSVGQLFTVANAGQVVGWAREVIDSFIKAALSGYLYRIMEAFGSTKSPEPLLVTAAGINAVTGRIVGHNAPFTIGKIEELAAAAVKDDSDEAVNNLLTAIRNTFALFEYFRDHRVVGQWNNVLLQVGLQCAHIEHVTGVTDLQKWWWIWAPDFFQVVQDEAQGWATAAIRAAAGAYTEARMVGRSLKTNDVVVAALSEFQSKVSLMRMPTMNADKTTITD